MSNEEWRQQEIIRELIRPVSDRVDRLHDMYAKLKSDWGEEKKELCEKAAHYQRLLSECYRAAEPHAFGDDFQLVEGAVDAVKRLRKDYELKRDKLHIFIDSHIQTQQKVEEIEGRTFTVGVIPCAGK